MKILEARYDVSSEFAHIANLPSWFAPQTVADHCLPALNAHIDEHHEVLTNHVNHALYNDYERGNLSDEQNRHLGGISDYTGRSRAINLRLMGRDFGDHNQALDDEIGHIRQGLAMAPATQHEIHSYSGLTVKKLARFTGFAPGQTALFKPLTSTSIHPAQTMGFAQSDAHGGAFNQVHIAHFVTPKGSKAGLYVDPISKNRGEREFLLRDNLATTYRGTTEHQSEDGGNRFYIHRFDVHDD